MRETLTVPKIGSRVWTIRGVLEHGHAKGLATNVPPHTGGEIISVEKPWYAPSVGSDLFVIRWDTGQVTEHSGGELGDIVCLGPFKNLVAFEEALGAAEGAEAVFGLKGEFREFKAVLRMHEQEFLVQLGPEQAQLWKYFWPVLLSANVHVRKTVRSTP